MPRRTKRFREIEEKLAVVNDGAEAIGIDIPELWKATDYLYERDYYLAELWGTRAALKLQDALSRAAA